jgi:hypothetical protein
MFKSLHSDCFEFKFDLAMNSNAKIIIQRLKEERLDSSSSLMSKFLICAPYSSFEFNIFYENLIQNPNISIVCLMYTIDQIATNNEIEFELSIEAKNEFFKINKEIGNILDLAHHLDEFISATFSRGTTHLIRLAGLITCLNNTVELLTNAPNVSKLELTQSFIDYVESNLVKNKIYLNQFKTIDAKTIQNANKLLNYFNAHKLVLADYDLNLNEDGSNLNELICDYLKVKQNSKMNRTKLNR